MNELIFKLCFGAAFVAAVAIAARTGKAAARQHGGSINQLQHEVPSLIAIRAALGIVFYASLIAWLFWTTRLRGMYLPLGDGVRWSSAALLFPILAFFAWSFRSIGVNYRGGVGLYDNHALVTAGAYRYVRHPIHASFIAIMVAVLGLSANWVLGISGLVLVSSIALIRIPIEDRELEARFGAEWRRYRDRTGSLFPHSGHRVD